MRMDGCYCNKVDPSEVLFMLVCSGCSKYFHSGCLESGKLSILEGDILFHFKCRLCGEDGKEFSERIKMQWIQVVVLSLYNLQLSRNGKCGFFRWKEHICAFIDKHWLLLFAGHRKKTSLWHGTVAGTLSTGCPVTFTSGSNVLGESGWWKLTEMKPPMYRLEPLLRGARRKPDVLSGLDQSVVTKVEGLRTRRCNKSSIQAAIDLKIKRSTLLEAKDIRQAKMAKLAELESHAHIKVEKASPTYMGDARSSVVKTAGGAAVAAESAQSTCTTESQPQSPLLTAKEEDDMLSFIGISASSLLQPDSDCDLDLDLDPVMLSPPSGMSSASFRESPSMDNILSVIDDNSMSSLASEPTTPLNGDDSSPEFKVETIKDVEAVIPDAPPLPKLSRLSQYEEFQLLKRLNLASEKLSQDIELNRLRRKLIVRQLKRERGIPIFDLDLVVNKFTKTKQHSSSENTRTNVSAHPAACILDRFKYQGIQSDTELPPSCSFMNRLIGFDNSQLESIRSPYTSRVLKPFIFRDGESKPLKMRLLEQIRAYPHRSEPLWKAPASSTIDYCYVRPHHIPPINLLCQEFFWPGIDLSECLNYPDFSCVVLYRKVVIGFAFMVPDVKYNEAYISFILTHPDWRRAGIATFMLYHLIQTCMGKDVTLHVSATNSAMLLYQKFGFKVEEIILDFYEKYYRADSRECKHAYFIRLKR